MSLMLVGLTVFLLTSSTTLGDVYLHNMRGSNNRLNEKSANRANANRLFDSQNNNRGGYNVGDLNANAFIEENQQYNPFYLASGTDDKADSHLTLEWTNQHGCGGNEETDPSKQNCNIVLQYMCQADSKILYPYSLRNGNATGTPVYTPPASTTIPETKANADARAKQVNINLGMHESFDWYDACNRRNRNAGLFQADQKLGGKTAIFTRQNPNGNRRGYECPEERDYYPYWHASPWVDIAVLTDNETHCRMYQQESFNVKPRSGCLQYYPDSMIRIPWSLQNTPAECATAGGQWMQDAWYSYIHKLENLDSKKCKEASVGSRWITKWAVPYDSQDGKTSECLVVAPAPECLGAASSRPNHLGNTLEGEPARYNWKLPALADGIEKRCVFRIRYNISTDDYDPFNTDYQFNGAKSPVKNNEDVNIGLKNNRKLRLAVNTAQYGRTFQDRSHVFLLKSRNLFLQTVKDKTSRIFNLNVRGKRGNIVQVFPAVEYDFIPNQLNIQANTDLIHMQWTGSNSHQNGVPGGDGQTGDDGQGTTGTDRSNVVALTNATMYYPAVYEWQGNKSANVLNLWKEASVVWSGSWNDLTPAKIQQLTNKDYAIYAATSGLAYCQFNQVCGSHSSESKPVNSLLNNTPASFVGLIFRLKLSGLYHYACTRNNNFSNRSQKGTIIVKEA